MDRNTLQYTPSHDISWLPDHWLSSGCVEGGPIGRGVCEQAARELGRRTGLLPAAIPAGLACFLAVTPQMAAFWLPVGALFSFLLFATVGQIHLARRIATADQPDLIHLDHYQNYVDITGLTWGCLIGLLLLVRGVDQVTELAMVASLAVFAGALTTLTLETNLWLRFCVALWLPLLVFTGAAATQGMDNGWLLLLIETLFGVATSIRGRHMVREYVDGLQAQNRLQQAMREIAEQRDSLAEHQTRLDEVLVRMHRLSYYDQLTGIGSRLHFYERLEQAVRLGRNSGGGFALLHLDLDGFKDINDTFGHEAGDRLLKIVSQRMSTLLHSNDFAARLGSDELALLIHGPTDSAHLARLAEQCLTEISRPLRLNGKRICPKASIGIAVYPQDGDNALALLKASESAMHSAKHSSHHFVRYRPQMSEEAEQRLTIGQELRQALDEHQFVLHYQAQVDAAGSRVCGVEALIRWQHPERGQISPLQFIPIAEQTGMIEEIGDWVLNQACRQAAEWFANGVEEFPISVNISPLQLLSRKRQRTGLLASRPDMTKPQTPPCAWGFTEFAPDDLSLSVGVQHSLSSPTVRLTPSGRKSRRSWPVLSRLA
jgi:diguanylate cyclase (GGDEF)-like protein